uniref:Uncharacterized protein n=1 Tax=Chromera velia CCMP2878 TaxID=1169474 RepID=A0A0G4FD99_9ALVE|eukprot:Cvel_16337.t1-p1 / transcript=Cvel_16337.t1 / gene=Cvel_16337 / organism=Chromera_velia_CCMP2878 / gene_product=hypothetical protein / transcript_product=hypothetical protein / location=Cvel_scaffold1254:2353-9305(+) / protein_length=661 / sequence_SO=supercontig / SO=protein_coding / is_pseudo=false
MSTSPPRQRVVFYHGADFQEGDQNLLHEEVEPDDESFLDVYSDEFPFDAVPAEKNKSKDTKQRDVQPPPSATVKPQSAFSEIFQVVKTRFRDPKDDALRDAPDIQQAGGREEKNEFQRRAQSAGVDWTSMAKELGSLPQELEQMHGDAYSDDEASMQTAQAELEGLWGSIEKRSPWWIEGWRKRNFVLKDKKFIWYPANNWYAPIGVLDFELVPCAVHCLWDAKESDEGGVGLGCDCGGGGLRLEDQVIFRLVPRFFPDKIFEFRGPIKQVGPLIRGLALHIAASMASAPSVPPPPSPSNGRGTFGTGGGSRRGRGKRPEQGGVTAKNFWRYNRIGEETFIQAAQTGDILLFRGKCRAAQFTRAVTGSLYDHVGMLLKTDRNELLILESSGGEGVALLPWKVFKKYKWHLLYHRLVFRKTYFDRSPHLIGAFQRFLKEVVGKPYGLTAEKILFRRKSAEFEKANDGEFRRVTHHSVPQQLKGEEKGMGKDSHQNTLQTAPDGVSVGGADEEVQSTGGGEREKERDSEGFLDPKARQEDNVSGEGESFLQRAEAIEEGDLPRMAGGDLRGLTDAETDSDVDSVGNAKKGKDDDEGERDSYFCSELVAHCLKRLGVLEGKRSASQFFPGSFSVHCYRGLPVRDGCAIGEELWIDFSLPSMGPG